MSLIIWGNGRQRGGRRMGMLAIAVGTVTLVVGVPTAASASLPAQVVLPSLFSTPSDTRADFFSGNATTCAGVGFPDSTQMGSPSNTSASDENVVGTVQVNAGTVQPGQGQELNVAIVGANVVVDAVVVKGGEGYNVYSDPSVLPPALPPDQHYISPLNGGVAVPNISHWFVCYQVTTPPPAGSLTVRKVVIPPDGIPAVPLPTLFRATVNCDDGIPEHQDVVVTFGGGGGRSAGPTLTDIPLGTVCTVVEDGTASLPPGSSVTYDPDGADDPGVTITGDAGLTVTITNDFTDVELQTGELRLVKVALPAPTGVTLPTSYTAEVLCTDGTMADVTLPGSGGDGTPVLTVEAGSLCTLGEDIGSLPPGWVVTYSVDGGPPSTEPPIFEIIGNASVSVTITNDPTAVTPPDPDPTPPDDPTTPPPTPTAPPPTGELPATGVTTLLPLSAGLVLVGLALMAFARRAALRP